jgi:hypothetical protein
MYRTIRTLSSDIFISPGHQESAVDDFARELLHTVSFGERGPLPAHATQYPVVDLWCL